MQVVLVAWLAEVAREVHNEAVKRQMEDGVGWPYDSDSGGRCEAESDWEAGGKRHLALS